MNATFQSNTPPAYSRRRLLAAVGIGTLAISLSACAPMLVGGAIVGGGMAATDRRTIGMQVEDQRIRLVSNNSIRDNFGDRVNVNVHTYNRRVLLTGQVPDQATRERVGRVIAAVPNVSAVINELSVDPMSSLSTRSSDTLLATRVKAAYVEAPDLFANSIRVTVETGVVYLMGRVTQREANRAADIASRVSGVRRVITVFEVISEEELQQMVRQPADNRSQQQGTINDGMR